MSTDMNTGPVISYYFSCYKLIPACPEENSNYSFLINFIKNLLFFSRWSGPYKKLTEMFNRAEPVPAISSGDWATSCFPQIIENYHL